MKKLWMFLQKKCLDLKTKRTHTMSYEDEESTMVISGKELLIGTEKNTDGTDLLCIAIVLENGSMAYILLEPEESDVASENIAYYSNRLKKTRVLH